MSALTEQAQQHGGSGTAQRFPRARSGVGFAVRNPLVVMLVGSFLFAAIFGPLVVRTSPSVFDLNSVLEPPSSKHLLGTDQFGRDLLSRLVQGAGVAAKAAVIVLIVGGICGTLLGVVAGGARGIVDMAISRVLEVVQGFPIVLLAIALVAMIHPSLFTAMLAVGIAMIPEFARVARGMTIQLNEREFAEAARSAGASEFRVLATEVFPNMLSAIAVVASFNCAQAVMYEAALSFLGLGMQPPTASFGTMLAESQAYFQRAPLYAVFPGIALAIVILGLNLLGDAIGDHTEQRAGRP